MNYFNSLLSGIKWTAISSISVSLLAVLKIAFLTNYLDKADFGHYALVISTLSFINLFADFGLPIAILHVKEISSKAFSSLYWISLINSLCIFLLFWGATPFISNYFREPILTDLLPVAGIAILINSVGNLYRVLALKNLAYSWISKVNILESLVSFLLAGILAILGWNIWALIYSLLFGKLVLELCFFWKGYQSFPIRVTFSKSAIKPYFNIGKYSIGGQILNYFNREIDILLIAKLGGDATMLGIYSLSKQLVLKIGGVVNQIIAEATRPILPRFQDNLIILKTNFLKIIQTTSTVNVTIYAIFLAFTPQIINLLYGDDYRSLVPITRILVIFAFLRNVIRFNGNLIIATGKTQLSFLMNAITLPLITASVWIGFSSGLPGIAWGQGFAMAVLLFISWYFVIYRLTSLKLRDYLIAFVPSRNLIKEVWSRIKEQYEGKNT